jgi:hypothetical protein
MISLGFRTACRAIADGPLTTLAVLRNASRLIVPPPSVMPDTRYIVAVSSCIADEQKSTWPDVLESSLE